MENTKHLNPISLFFGGGLTWLCDIATCVPISVHLAIQSTGSEGCAKSAKFTPRNRPDRRVST